MGFFYISSALAHEKLCAVLLCPPQALSPLPLAVLQTPVQDTEALPWSHCTLQPNAIASAPRSEKRVNARPLLTI